MFEKEQSPLNMQFTVTPDASRQGVESSFTERPYYAAFLQRLGLREIKDSVQYLLTQREGKNWRLPLEKAVEAMIQLQQEAGLTSSQTLNIMEFVIKKLDRNKSVPLYVGQYMCHDAIKRTVIQKFNKQIGCHCTSLTELSHRISHNIDEANEIFNSIRICDPAMGSGLFLVWLLNEMIAVKSKLGILADKEGNPLFHYKMLVKEGNLLVFDKRRLIPVSLASSDPESRRIQETLQYEKRRIIENCLFGVDMDPIAVTIAHLRLWIEMLKHAPQEPQKPISLPIIEANLRCGDSLISRFSVQDDLQSVFRRIGYSVSEYKKLAVDYKKASTREEKNSIDQLISLIKRKLMLEITWDDKNNEELLRWQRELATLKAPSLFEMDENEAKSLKKRLLEAQSMVDKYKNKIEDIKNNPIFKHAIEWRYDFPEMLNQSGDFTGFDFIIGNPPDTQTQIGSDSIDVYRQLNYKAYKRTGDVSCLFYELGNRILKPECFLSFIASNSWMKSVSASKMRQYLMEETNPLLMIEFNPNDKTDATLVDQGIVTLQKAPNQFRIMNCRIKSDFDPLTSDWEDYIEKNATLAPAETMTKGIETAPPTAFVILSDTENNIKEKIEQIGTPLETWDIQMYSGIKTGFDGAFIIDGKTKDEFILSDYKNVDIIKPLLRGEDVRRYTPEKSDKWLIFVPWHFPLLYDMTIKTASERAEQRFRQQYPVIYDHLSRYKNKLSSRDTAEVGVSFEWYALQNYGTSNEWDDFMQQKIVWKREAATSSFCLDYRGCAILDTTCFITGQHLKYILGVLNSKVGRYMLQDSPRLSNGDMQISILTLGALKIPVPNIKIESELISLVNKRTSDVHKSENKDMEEKIDRIIYEMYNLNDKERDFIESNIIPNV